MLYHGGIAPHLFQAIKLPGLGQHYMYHHIYIIDQYPLLGLPAFVLIRYLTAFFLGVSLNKICNGTQLGSVACLANDEKICNSFRYLTEVKANDIFAFLLLYSVNDGLENLAVPR